MTLTDHQRRHLVHCLRVAATQFDKDARVIRQQANPVNLLREFERYAADARDLADMMEDAQVEVKP